MPIHSQQTDLVSYTLWNAFAPRNKHSGQHSVFLSSSRLAEGLRFIRIIQIIDKTRGLQGLCFMFCQQGKKLHQLAGVPLLTLRINHYSATMAIIQPLFIKLTEKRWKKTTNIQTRSLNMRGKQRFRDAVFFLLPYSSIAFKLSIFWGRHPEVDHKLRFGSAARRRACRPENCRTNRWASPQQAGNPSPRERCRYPEAGASISNCGCFHGHWLRFSQHVVAPFVALPHR